MLEFSDKVLFRQILVLMRVKAIQEKWRIAKNVLIFTLLSQGIQTFVLRHL
jgi:hypothetical protein